MTNRIIVAGLLDEAYRGKRVLYLTGDHWQATCALDEARRLDLVVAQVITANGREEIRYPSGGHLTFKPAYTILNLRGMLYDLVYVDPEAERALRESPDGIHNLRAIVAATQGEILRA